MCNKIKPDSELSKFVYRCCARCALCSGKSAAINNTNKVKAINKKYGTNIEEG